MKIVEVTWVDSSAENKIWESIDDYVDDLPLIKTVGYLLKKDKNVLVVCQSYHDDEVGRVFRIPITCILETKNIRGKK
jgi:hypothetical protein